MKTVLALLALLAMVACATSAGRRTDLKEQLRESSIDDLIRALGPPALVYPLPNGNVGVRFVNSGISADDRLQQALVSANAYAYKDPLANAVSSGPLPQRSCVVDAEIDPQSRRAVHIRVTGEGC